MSEHDYAFRIMGAVGIAFVVLIFAAGILIGWWLL